ncbi:unnamed protein product, partial [Mesorhabditis belari]|uniref:DUF3105 domain-containing protein n=1 Tax=Mesorhabditis belari TaxID=2138241 RepID=A0AAF3E9L8_9BILA
MLGKCELFVGLICLVGVNYGYMGAMMGQITTCDDGKTGIEIDWDPNDFSVFTCPNRIRFARREVDPVLFEIPDFNARTDQVGHKCVNEKIVYKEVPPLRGDHRPNWPRYGEYLYVPPQRWLHNLEHGTIVLLYHPCTDLEELQKLRHLVTGCLWRHIVTPYNRLSEQRPLALVAWGAKLELNLVDERSIAMAVAFIRKHARVAPEDISRDGIYDHYLMVPARIVSDQADSKICPDFLTVSTTTTPLSNNATIHL